MRAAAGPDAVRPGNLIVLTGPSGVGKGVVREHALARSPRMVLSVSVTTRPRRAHEVDGVDYFFRTEEEFAQLRSAGKLLEWTEFAGAYYGTPRAWVEDRLAAGLDVLLEIEVRGAKQVKAVHPEAVLVFLSPPSFDALRDRLHRRGTESPDKIALRLRKAEEELRERHIYHYEIVNDDVDVAATYLVHIVHAERCRIRRDNR